MFRELIESWWHDMKEVFTDIGVLIFVIAVPLAYPLIYAYVYNTEIARDVTAAVVDDSQSNMSREFIRKIDAAPEMAVYAKCTNMAEAQDLMMKREVYGIVHIPKSFEDDLRKGKQTRVGVYCDVSSMIYYKNLLLPCTNASLEMNKLIRVEKFKNLITDREREVAMQPVKYQHVQLFNPQGGYDSFLLPPVLMLIIQQTMLLGMGMAMGKTREKNRGYALDLNMHLTHPVSVLLGRMMIYVPLYILLALYMYTVVTQMFTFPQLGHYWDFVGFIIPYVIDCCVFGLVLASLLYRREDSILMFVFMSVPLLFMSGVSWPGSNLPDFWYYVGRLFPSSYGINGYVRLTSMGASLKDLHSEMTGIVIQTAVYFVIAMLITRLQIIRVEKGRKLGIDNAHLKYDKKLLEE